MKDEQLDTGMMHCGLCGASIESRKDGNRHIRDDHSALEVLKYDLFTREPPIKGDCSV